MAVRDAGGRATCQNFASDCKVLAFAEAQPLPIGELRGVRRYVPLGGRQKAGLTLAITHSVIGREKPASPERSASGTTRPSAPRLGVVGERELTGSLSRVHSREIFKRKRVLATH